MQNKTIRWLHIGFEVHVLNRMRSLRRAGRFDEVNEFVGRNMKTETSGYIDAIESRKIVRLPFYRDFSFAVQAEQRRFGAGILPSCFGGVLIENDAARR